MDSQFTIVIADDHPLFRGALYQAVHMAIDDARLLEADSIDSLSHLLAEHPEVDLLLLDRLNPRSVKYQADALAADLTLIGDEASAARALRMAQALDETDAEQLLQPERLATHLASLEQEFRRLSNDLAVKHFVRQAPRRPQTAGWSSPWQVTDGH